MADQPVSEKIRDLWNDIVRWYDKHAPHLHGGSRASSSEEQIRDFEKEIGLTLPEDYLSSLEKRDGGGTISGYEYLSVEQALNLWKSLTQKSEQGAFINVQVLAPDEGIMQRTWWSRGWIPIAQDSGGNLYCIDLAPGDKGVRGQILKWEREEGPFRTSYSSFLQWLQAYRDALYQGKYSVDENGELVERQT